jgi:AraC family transcriptional regulator of adaptative response/methylated-DNA-[protein]-cysteine methyltransferase
MKRSAEKARFAAATERESRWAAVAARDPKADGKFYYSVETTGVYCRPSCAARLARPEHVRFHETCEEAENAGFRPCKRCRPDQASLAEQQATKIAAACRRIENSDEEPSLERLSQEAGMSIYHFHRVFKAITGLTPKKYAAAHREKRVRSRLGESGRVTDAIYEAGYNSNGRFYETSNRILGMTPSNYRPAAQAQKYGSPSASVLSDPSSSRVASVGFVPFFSETIPTHWRGIYRTNSRRPI